MDIDVVKLAELLSPKRQDESDSDNDQLEDIKSHKNIGQPQTPSEITTKKSNYKCPYAKVNTSTLSENIVQENGDFEFVEEQTSATSDWRKAPQWEVSYKQQVTPCDMFLQISGKNPSTASCEDMIIKIHLPEEKHRNIDLKILSDKLLLTSPKFRLDLPLPQPVDPKYGNAQWDKDSEKLAVTLRMQRDFDFVNF